MTRLFECGHWRADGKRATGTNSLLWGRVMTRSRGWTCIVWNRRLCLSYTSCKNRSIMIHYTYYFMPSLRVSSSSLSFGSLSAVIVCVRALSQSWSSLNNTSILLRIRSSTLSSALCSAISSGMCPVRSSIKVSASASTSTRFDGSNYSHRLLYSPCHGK